MKKLVALAALVGGMTVASAPVTVTPVMAKSTYPAHCLVLPLWQKECRQIIFGTADKAAMATTAAATTAASTAATMTVNVVGPWHCERRTDGKALWACSK